MSDFSLADSQQVERDDRGWPGQYSILTTAELEVVTLIAQGFSQKEIAAHRESALKTVSAHALNAYGKLGIHNRRDIWPALLTATARKKRTLTQQMIALGFAVFPLPPESAAAIDLAAHFQRSQPSDPACTSGPQIQKDPA